MNALRSLEVELRASFEAAQKASRGTTRAYLLPSRSLRRGRADAL